jgi:transcriptional regulator with XRE-family HTH domain
MLRVTVWRKGEQMICMTVLASKLKQVRDSTGVTQEAVAQRTRTNLRTYARAESGKYSVKYDTAMEILGAINTLRAEKSFSLVTLQDLGLKIY